MSLINDMLNNLEQRKHPNAVAYQPTMADLKTDITHEFSRNKNYYLMIILLGGVLLCACIYLWINHPARTINLATANTAHANNNLTAPATSDKTLLNAPVTPAMLTGIALQVQPNSASLRFFLNQRAFYRVSSDVARNEFIIIFEKTHLLAALPKINYVGSGVENIRAYIDEKGNLKLVLQLADDVDIHSLELNEEGKAPELRLELFIKNAATTTQNTSQKSSTIPVTIKKPVAENQAELQYQQALTLTQNGQTRQAINLLTAVLVNFPQYNLAREKLAALFLESGQINSAGTVIAQGLHREPDYLPYTELKARLLMQTGKINDAITLLEVSAPPLATNPEYHAFIAALYQRAGKPQLAANLYKQLITLQSSNGKWWLGLGVALESLGNHEQAMEAYANADSSGGLTPELKAYISTQLHNV